MYSLVSRPSFHSDDVSLCILSRGLCSFCPIVTGKDKTKMPMSIGVVPDDVTNKPKGTNKEAVGAPNQMDEEDLRRQEEEKQSEVAETAKPMDREIVHSGQRTASPQHPKPAAKPQSAKRSAGPKQKRVGHVPDSVFHRIDQVLYC